MPPITLNDAVARADEVLQSVISDYPKHLEVTFAEMEDLARDDRWEELRVVAHDLKGQAATVGWPLIGLIARSLEAAVLTGATKHFPEVTRVHIQSMRLCVSANMRDPNLPAARHILDELHALTARMSAAAAQ